MPLGEVTTQVVDPVPIHDDKTYSNLGLRMYAGGVFEREAKSGADIKATRLFRVRAGQFIYNRLFASGGSFGLVRPEHEHGVVSSEFPVFDLDTDRLLPEYLYLHFQQPSTWETVAEQCIGTTQTRLRWKEERFRAYEVPLPSVDEQRRIVDLVGALDDTIAAAEKVQQRLSLTLAKRRDMAFSQGEMRTAAEAFDILLGLQRSPARAAGPDQTPYLRSANVTHGRLLLDDVKTMSFDAKQRAKYALQPGDVLVSEGSASADAVGAPSRFSGELEGTVCFQNTLLRYRAVDGITTPEFVSQWCSWAYESGAFRDAANGTNIKHIGARGASAMRVLAVPVEEQDRLTSELAAAETAVERARTTVASLRDLRSNLLTGLLSGEHPISESYDELMEDVAA